MHVCSVHPKGSRLVQQAIEVVTPEEIDMVYREITPRVRLLAVDAFGNYEVQKVNFCVYSIFSTH
jgi:pumilio RNA-binding family